MIYPSQGFSDGCTKTRIVPPRPAVFLDRDGVINFDKGYVGNESEFDFIEGVFGAARALKWMGYLLVLVTNQSGIARGKISDRGFLSLTYWMNCNFRCNGVSLDGIFYCPHHPEFGIGRYKQDCHCRKPKPGMLISARDYLRIDLARSVMVGDKAEDMMAADAVGINTRILVRTGSPVNHRGKDLATVVLDSIRDVPSFLRCPDRD